MWQKGKEKMEEEILGEICTAWYEEKRGRRNIRRDLDRDVLPEDSKKDKRTKSCF